MPLNIDWQQILLHLLNFAILCGGLYLLLYKPVKDFMARRLTQYEAREAETRQREADADAMKEKYQSMLRQAEQEILARREKVGEELEEEKRQQLSEARAEARKILSTAAKTAELRTKKALEDSHEEIRALAIGMVERMVVENSGDALDQFLNEAEGGTVKPVKSGKSAEASGTQSKPASGTQTAPASSSPASGTQSAPAKAADAKPSGAQSAPAKAAKGAVKPAASNAAKAGGSAAGSKAVKNTERGTRRG